MNHHFAIICLGSNAGDASTRIVGALTLLGEEGWCFLALTPVYQTSAPYSNCLAYVALSGDDYDSANRLAKQVERRLGRTPQSKASGLVPIDIDIVIYDQTIMRPADYESAYFQEGLAMLRQKTAKAHGYPPITGDFCL